MLRSLHERKFRRQAGLFLAEGMRHCTEAVQMGYQPMRLVYAQGREADKGMTRLIDVCQKAGGRILPVTPNLLSRISGKDNPQTVMAAFCMRYGQLSDVHSDKNSDDIWVALDRVRDPGNLGTIMRTADAVAAKGIILIEDCTDPYSVEAVRASMGAVFYYQDYPVPAVPILSPGRRAGAAKLSAQHCRLRKIIAQRTGKSPLSC